MSVIIQLLSSFMFFFFFNDTATTEIYTLSLHDALPICRLARPVRLLHLAEAGRVDVERLHVEQHLVVGEAREVVVRSEEHTSELQSPCNLVCRLLLEKKKIHKITTKYCYV